MSIEPDGFTCETLSPTPAMAVRATVTFAELPAFFERAFHAVYATLARAGVEPAGPPFGFYPEPPAATVVVEAGFPVPPGVEVPTDGEVHRLELPGGRVVTAVHVGSFDELEQTYGQLLRWMAEQGLTPGEGGMWESYLSDPEQEPDPRRWRTRIVWPIAS